MFSDALLAADKYYYKSPYDSRKKEQKDKDKLSANKKKCLAHKEEEKQKQLDAQSNAIKSNLAIKDLNCRRKRVKHALHHEDLTVSHKKKRREDYEKDLSSQQAAQQNYEPCENVRNEKPEKPKANKRITPPMDFHQLLMLAKKNKSEPINIAAKKQIMGLELDTLMTNQQNMEYEEEMARRKQRPEKMDVEKSGHGKVLKFDKPDEKRKLELNLSDKYYVKQLHGQVKSNEKEKNRSVLDREKAKERGKSKILKYGRKKAIINTERIEKHKSDIKRIGTRVDPLNRDLYTSDETNFKLESKSDTLNIKERNNKEKKNVDVKSQNTYQLEKRESEMKSSIASDIGDRKQIKMHTSHKKLVCKKLSQTSDNEDKHSKINQNMHTGCESLKNNGMDKSDSAKGLQGSKDISMIRFEDKKLKATSFATQPKITNSFNFDEYVNSIKKKGACQYLSKIPKKPKKKRQIFDSESDVEDCIDENK